LLNKKSSVQECDARGDAILINSRVYNNLNELTYALITSFSVLTISKLF